MLLKVDYAPQIRGKAYSRRFVRPSVHPIPCLTNILKLLLAFR